MIQKTMWVYESKIEEQNTFRLLPMVQESPFVEAAYDPKEKVLVILSKEKTTVNLPTPRLDAKGKENGITFKLMDRFFEHHISNPEDIKNFIHLNVMNSKHKILKILDE